MRATRHLDSVKGMESPAPYILIISLPPLLVAVIISMNAKKTNAKWRAKREARAQAKASAQ